MQRIQQQIIKILSISISWNFENSSSEHKISLTNLLHYYLNLSKFD